MAAQFMETIRDTRTEAGSIPWYHATIYQEGQYICFIIEGISANIMILKFSEKISKNLCNAM
jgi:hypothetical protein